MKVLRNILLILSLAAMSSTNLDAMKRKHVDANTWHETHILVFPHDLLWVIAQYLDGKAFSALTLTCKSNEYFLNKMPVQYLLCVNCAEVITHGNVNLTRRYLQNTSGTWLLESVESQTVGEPEYIDNYLQPQLIKFLFGGQRIYSMAKKVDAPDEVFYFWPIKGSPDNCAMLIFVSQEVAQDDGKPFRSLNECIGRELNGVVDKALQPACKPVVCGDQSELDYMKAYAPSDALVSRFYTSDNKPHGDICLINTQNAQNRERTRFDYFCLNMLFIVAAQKNLDAIIDVFLQGESVCDQLELPTLTIAADMATDGEIKVGIAQEFNKRFVIAARKNDGKIIERFLQVESIAQQLTESSLIIALDITTDDVIKQVLDQILIERARMVEVRREEERLAEEARREMGRLAEIARRER